MDREHLAGGHWTLLGGSIDRSERVGKMKYISDHPPGAPLDRAC